MGNILLATHRVQWWAVLNTVTSFRFHKSREISWSFEWI